MTKKILYLMKGYPRYSETFIAQEIHLLEQLGFDLHIVSLRLPDSSQRHPIHDQIKAPVLYLPEYLKDEPIRVLKALFNLRNFQNKKKMFRFWWQMRRYSKFANWMRRLGQAIVLANEFPEDIAHIHVHFLHTPGTVGCLTSMLTNLKWSCSAHAKDIWTITEQEKKDKLNDMQWLTTCTRTGQEHLQTLVEDPKKIHLDYHGVDFTRFEFAEESSALTDKFAIVSVGRPVDKKGYKYLLLALSILNSRSDWHFYHIGQGELLDELKEFGEELGLQDRITWYGAKPQPFVLGLYRQGDLFVLPCIQSEDGDRDGIPNVFVEAQSQKLCCLATDLPSVLELIDHEKTGYIVPQRDPHALAEAITYLIEHPEELKKFANAGQKNVLENFDCQKQIHPLAARLRAECE